MPEQRPFPFTMGADPEFNILIGSRKADASSVMKAILKDDHDEAGMGYKIGNSANIGWDGCSSTGEVRPSPSNLPEKLVANLRAAFEAVTKKIGIFDYSTHSKKAPVGGHIHFAVPEELYNNKKKMELIHKCMSSFYLPVMIGENITNMNLRMGGHSYGQMRDYRVDGRGANIYTYEFRVPTAEWMTTPKIAKAVLAYTGVVFSEIMKDPAAFNKKYSNIVWNTFDQGDAIQKLLLSDYTGPILKIVESTRKAVRSFEFYKDYKDEIEYIFRPKVVLNDKEKSHFNIVEGWGLQGKTPSKRQIINSSLCTRMENGINFDAFASSIAVPHNGDVNTELFSLELKRRIVNFGWKMKNSYFIYGLKKGVEDFIAFDKSGNLIYDGGQIKTTTDMNFATDLMLRMSNKFPFDRYASTAKEKAEMSKEYIMVGIPYSMRTTNKTKPFLQFIYDIESGKHVAHPLVPSTLINDSGKDEQSLFAKIYNASSRGENEDVNVEEARDALVRDRQLLDTLRMSAAQEIDEDVNKSLNQKTLCAV